MELILSYNLYSINNWVFYLENQVFFYQLFVIKMSNFMACFLKVGLLVFAFIYYCFALCLLLFWSKWRISLIGTSECPHDWPSSHGWLSWLTKIRLSSDAKLQTCWTLLKVKSILAVIRYLLLSARKPPETERNKKK